MDYIAVTSLPCCTLTYMLTLLGFYCLMFELHDYCRGLGRDKKGRAPGSAPRSRLAQERGVGAWMIAMETATTARHESCRCT